MNTYHYSLEGKSLGPVTLEQLKGLSITKETLVWKEGLSQWVKAGELEELEVLFKTVPPPLNQTVPPPLNQTVPPPLKNTNFNPSENHHDDKKNNLKSVLIWSGIVTGLIGFIVIIINTGKKHISENEKNITTISDTNIAVEVNDTSSINYDQFNNGQENKSKSSKKAKKKTQDELNLERSKKEINNPASYITASFTSKVNLAANTVLEGHIYSSASLANFQNVLMKVRFYSKTGEELNSENFTISSFLPAGGSAYFKHKLYGWTPKVDHLDYTIISAEGFYDEPCRL